MRLPLEGITVIELGHSVAAPFAGQVLADLGAKVLKIENPDGGDDARGWGPPFWHGSSAAFQSLNRNKLSVAVDLKDPDERAALRDFILREADVVLQNMRPGLISRLGLDDRLVDEAPRLVYCNLGAFGSPGPLSEKPGYDPMMQAFGGIMSITGEEGRPPVRVGPSIVDIGAGLWCVIGILSALTQRAATGRGCRVDASLFETALAWMTVPAAIAMSSGAEQGRTGSEAAMLVPYKAYRAKDKYLIIAAGNDNLFERLANAFGRTEWVSDARFKTNADRVVNRDVLNALVEDTVGTQTADVWMRKLDAAGVPCAPIQGMKDVLAHAQTRSLGILQETPDGTMTLMGLPLRFDGARPPVRLPPPTLGAHSAEVLRGKAKTST